VRLRRLGFEGLGGCRQCRSVFENIAERDRFAHDFDAAYLVGWNWTVRDDRVVGPIITLGYPADLDRGILGLASADSDWSIHAVGPARWFPTFAFGDDVEEAEAVERIVEAPPGTIPSGATVEAVVAEIRLAADGSNLHALLCELGAWDPSVLEDD